MEVLNMVVLYNFDCPWNISKRDRISRLVLERTLLLTGTAIYEKIANINFCESNLIECKVSGLNYFLSFDRTAVLEITNNSYELIFEKNILFSMLTPGSGQSRYDNLVLELTNVQQN